MLRTARNKRKLPGEPLSPILLKCIDDLDVVDVDGEALPATATPTSVSKRRRTLKTPFTNREGTPALEEEPVQADEAVSQNEGEDDVEPNGSWIEAVQDEIQSPELSAIQQRKRKKRKSIGQQRKKRRSSGDGTTPQATSHQRVEDRSVLHDDDHYQDEDRGDEASDPENGSEEDHHERTILPEQSTHRPGLTQNRNSLPSRPKRRKRKSVGQQRKKRRSSDLSSSNSIAVSAYESPPKVAEQDQSEDLRESEVEAEEPDQQDATDDETFMPEARDQEDGEETQLFERPRKQKKKASRTTRRRSDPPKRDSNSDIPILTHRLTNFSALATIPEDHAPIDIDTDAGTDPLTDSFTTRPSPNAIDVLAQICRETVDTVLENIDSRPSSTTSALNSTAATSNKAKAKATATHRLHRSTISTFGSTLSAHLFHLSQFLDQKQLLEKRLRKAKRDRAETQARWFAVRKQREEVALRSDEVRRRHMRAEREEEGLRALSEGAGRVEGGAVMSRGRLGDEKGDGKEAEDVFEGLELRVRDVVGKVGRGDDGGLLERVRAFNAVLEQVAGVLEGS